MSEYNRKYEDTYSDDVSPESPIRVASMQIGGHASRLDEQVKLLHKRLSPILRQNDDTPHEGALARAVLPIERSPFAEELRAHGERLDGLIGALGDLLARIEL